MQIMQDYEILEKITETRTAVVFRGIKQGENLPVVIKSLKARLPSPSEITRFKKEYEIIKSIDLDGIVKTLDLINIDNRFSLILEDFNGISIKRILEKKKYFDLPSFLHIASEVSKTLGELHKRDVIHKDIKPHNILMNENGVLKITDFGIASVITHEKEEIYNPEVVEGTLFYLSPEQTGRMNRSVDYRSDFYSLGVSFYEMLTGNVPFISKDPLGIIHSHIARKPIPVAEFNRDIPTVLSDIIMKLLEKNAEDRYQNAFGLMADLEHCMNQLKSSGTVGSFELAKQDVSNRFIVPQKLFGRKEELASLLAGFDRASRPNEGGQRKVEVTIVIGPPGIGKSALINEIHKPIVEKRGYFLSGKYEQFRSDKPYSAIIQAFQGALRQILSESKAMVEGWKRNILNALGPNGRIIINMIPDLLHIIGPQPEVPELGPKEAQNRFSLVFERFISVFAKKEHPIALFLDDMQWADTASLQLIENIVTNPEMGYIYLIGSYRNNEVSETHQLTETLHRIASAEVALNRIHISELTIIDITNLIVNFLKCSDKKARPLAEVVYEKTKGNPFFVNQFIKTLYDEKMIEIDATEGWKWDVERISELSVTDNVVELMAEKIIRLSREVQEILKICACIGNRFDLEMLSLLTEKPIDDVLAILTEAMNEGFIGSMGELFVFYHDRIQEAAYSLIDEENKPLTHYRIAKLVLAQTDERELQNKLFYIADQFNLGIALVQDNAERERLAAMNLACAKKAKVSAAYQPALIYLRTGLSLIGKDHWSIQYDLALALHCAASEAAFLTGDMDTMNQYAAIVIESSKDIYDAMPVYETQIDAFVSQSNFPMAIEVSMDVLRKLNYPIPASPGKMNVVVGLMKIKSSLLFKDIEALINLPEIADARILAILNILSVLGYCSFYTSPELFAITIIKEFELSMKHGHCAVQPFNYIGIATIFNGLIGDIEAGYKLGKLGIDLCKKLNAKRYEAKTMCTFYITQLHWKQHIKSIRPGLMKTYHIGLETGDLEWAAISIQEHDDFGLFLGHELTTLEQQMEKTYKIIKQLKQDPALGFHSISWQVVLNLLGRNEDPAELEGSVLSQKKMVPLWESLNTGTMLGAFYSYRIFLKFLFYDFHGAIDEANIVAKYSDTFIALPTVFIVAFFSSLSRLSYFNEATASKRREYKWHVRTDLKRFKKWAVHAPMNHAHRVAILEAELSRVSHDHSGAEAAYEKAIQLSRENEYIIDEAIANELAAKYYFSRGKHKFAKTYLTDAYVCYAKWGAVAKLKHLQDMYPETLSPSTAGSTDSLFDTSTTTNSLTGKYTVDISTMVKASQTLSGEVVLDKLLTKMMKIVIENAGAQRGFIILNDNGRLTVEAESIIDSEEVTIHRSMEIESCDRFSISMINYVARTNELLLLNNATIDGDYTTDPYVIRNNPKSILCTPILNQGKLTAILYLENNLSTGAFTHQRVEVLNMLSSQIAISIDNAKLYENLEEKVRQRTKELRTARDALWGEMRLAKKIQTVLLPEKPSIKGYEIVGYMEPADEVGGDYYDIVNVQDKDWIVIGDVSGHGVTSGLIMMMVQTSIHLALKMNPHLSPSELFTAINAVIRENIAKMDEDKYMTLTLIACLEQGKLLHSGLHQDIMIYRAKKDRVEAIETRGMWLGIVDDLSNMLSDESVSIDTGDTMLLFTDGITEARQKETSADTILRLEQARLQDTFKKYATGTLENIKTGILNELENCVCDDDVTFVLVRRIE